MQKVFVSSRHEAAPDSLFSIFTETAEWSELSPNCSCGHADGIGVDPSWSPHGYSGGVMDIKDMIALRNWLTEQINVFTDAAKEDESSPLEPVNA